MSKLNMVFMLSVLKFGIHAECTCQIRTVSDLRSSNSGEAILGATRCTINHFQQSNSAQVI